MTQVSLYEEVRNRTVAAYFALRGKTVIYKCEFTGIFDMKCNQTDHMFIAQNNFIGNNITVHKVPFTEQIRIVNS